MTDLTIHMEDFEDIGVTPVNKKTLKYGNYKGNPIEVCVKLAKPFVRWKAQWRRVYVGDEGRFYIWLEGRPVWFCAELEGKIEALALQIGLGGEKHVA